MNEKKIIIFTGPSLSVEEASKILNADYRKPVKRGDILTAINDSPDIIGIIDGVFHQNPAVGHKEILEAMNKGIIVVGGSSMGALRASELNDLGMIGIGYVYNEYANGNIESDDDVAITFDSFTGEPVSEALVNIDYNLNKAIEKDIITSDEKNEIISIAKSIYYPNRTYHNILNKSNLDENKKKELTDFIVKSVDIKKQDAIAVLEYIKNLI
ncbi:TfuA-related McrA-glycine thioamidation protein [Methanobrevibacter sp. TMH8]|uniref:TfuA-related McrA-glycine thioamidation protein n=1 Tax=Methanobrevibacter sp. TMH8 TaxID=2848611 RepID=UPI001CC8EDE7|nr:TfuA-related McrA-glycine thioamidation protein [Methanobrevibacter sp. TMH8]MBZ9569997.1 TfuA-related McrA-glycine thioamidation protein [Methanobrevibacter sp. TMH8]